MENSKFRAIVLTGPTASGKSALAIRLARKIGGEIISADSRQIFCGLNIGSGKVRGSFDPEKRAFLSEGIPHHLIDIAAPMEDFNVSHFVKAATEKIKEISRKRKVPIICGGSVFWLWALWSGATLPEVSPDKELRSRLSKKSADELLGMLASLDKRRASSIDPHNKVRLIRAIEIATKIGRVPELKSAPEKEMDILFLKLSLDVPKEKLREKISQRIRSWIEEGLVAETESLLKQGVAASWLEKIGLEYRQTALFLQGKVAAKDLERLIFFDNVHYAKRQMTWLKKEKDMLWVRNYEEILSASEKFLAS